MSPQNHWQRTSELETVPLLGDTQQATRASESQRFRYPAETLLIPVALATRLAPTLSQTTLVDLVRHVVCRLWKASQGDDLPSGSPTPPGLCDTPEIARYFSMAITIMGTMEGILSIVGCGILSRISSRYGRKPAFLLVLCAGIMGSSLIAWSERMPNWLTDWAFLTGLLFQLFSGPQALLYSYLCNVFIVDVCLPEDRTAALSKMAGWATLGTCISFALGGSITTKTGNSLIVFHTATAIYVVTLIYIVLVLPESFPEDKRSTLSRMRTESSDDSGMFFNRVIRSIYLLIFEPLKLLMPTHKLDGTRNWRLLWCAVHTFIFMAVNSYALTAWLVLVTSKYHLTPADTGLFLAIVTVCGTVFLTVVVPPLVRFLRPYYSRKTLIAENVDTINGEGTGPDMSDQLDVHLAFVACVSVAICYLTAAASRTNTVLILSGVFSGFGFMHVPAIRSLVAGSVNPLKQGEAIAAVEIVSNVGSCLSPIIMGSLLTATIDTMPLLVFYVNLIVVFTSGLLLFLVRDADRYRDPR